MLSKLSILLLLICYTTRVYGICNESEITCDANAERTCTIEADNASRTNYLIEKCSLELAQTGITDITFTVNVQEINGAIILDIADDITIFHLYTIGRLSIEFNKTQTQIQRLSLTRSSNYLFCPFNLLNYFPSLTYLNIQNAAFDSFPSLNSISITQVGLYYLKLPSVVTILPSMLLLPNLDRLSLYQSKNEPWYNLVPHSFDNTRIQYLFLRGIQYLHSYHFATLTRLTTLYLREFFTNFTFEENALDGLHALTRLHIESLETNLDFVTEETFPSLILFHLGYSLVTNLNRAFFERHKMLATIEAPYNRLNCACEMAWLIYATGDLGWSVSGTCDTPTDLNGNSISNSSNYNSCPNQPYHCFDVGFVCPRGTICVNTAYSVYCDCGQGYTLNETSNCEDINECSTINNCEHTCINTVGSYNCSCNAGFTLQSDMSSCVSGVSQLIAPILLAILSLVLQISLL